MTRRKAADTDWLADALPAFISEANEQIQAFEQLMLGLEATPDDREMLDALFRCAHTIKGSAGVFGLDAVVGFTHHVETLLDLLREGKVRLDPALGTLLLKCNDQIRELVARQPGQVPTEAARSGQDDLVARVQAACAPACGRPAARTATAPTATSGPTRRWQLAMRYGRETFRNGMDPLAILNYVADLGTLSQVRFDLDAVPALEDLEPETCHVTLACLLESEASREEIEAAFVFVRDDCAVELTEADPVAGTEAGSASDPAAEEATPAADNGRIQKAREGGVMSGDDGRYIRVQASRLDSVINLLGELVIASAGAAQLAQDTRQRRLVEANLQITQLVEEIRNGTLQLRMVPIGETFARFRRVVRDTAAELGKQVNLELVGSETELDKSVVERIADPLMHLVRNALDHGLEAPPERLAAGKDEQGQITLAAAHEAGGIVITISDDGRGIQREKVLERAWQRGLLPQGEVPAESEILKLIFEPGFSTAEKVTNLSGRGVGMDVVRRNIEALRGSVNVFSEAGRGSRVEIRLPLTLAIIDGFLVGVGNSRFIFPLETVIEVVENRHGGSVDSRGRSVIELRGQPLPVVDLRILYSLDEPQPELTSVVVIRSGEGRYGVVVDRLLGQHQTVIKPLGRLFRSLRGISGSSILGNGEVALIFDVPTLGALSASAGQERRPAPTPPLAAARQHATTSNPIQ